MSTHTTTIRELLEEALVENKENFDGIIALGISTNSEPNYPLSIYTDDRDIHGTLSFPHEATVENGDMPYFCAWTENHIYIYHSEFIPSSDGNFDYYRTKIISVPKNPEPSAKITHTDL